MTLVTRNPRWGTVGGVLALLLALFAAPTYAQGVGTVSGQVADGNLDLPVPGANVRLQGTTIGAATDVDGIFSFTAPEGEYTLVVSALGFTTVSQPIQVRSGANVDLNIVLEEDALLLDDVVVTGYSNRERRNVATSISSIDGSEIEDLPVASVDGALQGRSAGVTVLRSSGTPGGGISVRVRGSTSISGSNEPLYVVDGVVLFNSAGGLSGINPSDIQSVEVLKGGEAAIYGSQGSNGVILITTKRGRR